MERVGSVILRMFFILLMVWVVGLVSVVAHYHTYKRDSYSISECQTTYKFANFTFYREYVVSASLFTRPESLSGVMLFYVYSPTELNEAGLLEELFSEVTFDEAKFSADGNGTDGTAVILLRTIPGEEVGEEPLYCVIDPSAEGISPNMLMVDESLQIAVHVDRRSEISFEEINTVISWGWYWRGREG